MEQTIDSNIEPKIGKEEYCCFTLKEEENVEIIEESQYNLYNLMKIDFELKEEKVIKSLFDESVHCLVFDSTKHYLAVGLGNGTLIIYSYPEFSVLTTINCRPSSKSFLVQSVAWKAHEAVLASCYNRIVEYNMLYQEKSVPICYENELISAISASDLLEMTAVALESLRIDIFNYKNELVSTIGGKEQNTPHFGKIFSLNFIPKDKTLISAANDDNLVFWDIKGYSLSRKSN